MQSQYRAMHSSASRGNYSLELLDWVLGLLVKVIRLPVYLMFMVKNCFLLCVIGLTTACIICCQVNVILDRILGREDILISWSVIMYLY